jgi:hypothetical protein
MTAQEMQNRLGQVNLADIAFDVVERADLPQSQREDEELYAGSPALGFNANGFRLAPGLVQGNRLQALLQDWTSAVSANNSFNQLPIPFRARCRKPSAPASPCRACSRRQWWTAARWSTVALSATCRSKPHAIWARKW